LLRIRHVALTQSAFAASYVWNGDGNGVGDWVGDWDLSQAEPAGSLVCGPARWQLFNWHYGRSWKLKLNLEPEQ